MININPSLSPCEQRKTKKYCMKKLILLIAIIGFAFMVSAQTTNEVKKETVKTEQTPSDQSATKVSNDKTTTCSPTQNHGKSCTSVCKDSKACTAVSKDVKSCTCVCQNGQTCTGVCKDGKTCTCVCKDGKKCTGVCNNGKASHKDCPKK